MRDYKLILNLVTNEKPGEKIFKQYDTGNEIELELYQNEHLNADEKLVLTNESVLAFFKRQDGQVLQKNCTIRNGNAIVKTAKDVLGVPGILELECMVKKGDVETTTTRMTFTVQESIARDGAIEEDPRYTSDLVTELLDVRDNVKAETIGKIEEVASQLETNANNFANKNNSVGAVVTFIDDNGEKLFNDTWDVICNDTGVKIGVAVVSDWVGTNPSHTQKGYLSVDDLKLLQSQGHEIYSHSKSHADWKNLNEQQIEEECKLSKQFLDSNGLSKESDILVYSNGIKSNDLRVKNIARKYYKYGVSTFMAGNTNYNPTPVDNWAVIRMDADNSTLEQMKSALDEAIATNGWLIFMSHSFNFAEGSIQKFKDFINYAKELNVPILPFKQASLLKGNVMAQGEKTSSNKVFISADGRGDINNIEGLKILTDSNMDADLSNYPVGYMSVKKISSGNDTHFRTGGTLITYNFFDISGYAIQVFHCYNKNQSHKRIWNGSGWGDWVLNDVYLDTGYNITDLLDKYTTGISLRKISPPNDTIFGVGGALITFNYSTLAGYSFQMLVQKDLGKIYIRNWNGTAWGDFIGDSYIVSQTKDSGSILNKAITEFKQFSTVVTAVSNTANAPDGASGGIYTVTRFSASMEHYGYSEYKVYNKNDLYRRYWTTGGAWSAWEKVTPTQV